METVAFYDAGRHDVDLYYVTVAMLEVETRKTVDIATHQDDLKEGFESVVTHNSRRSGNARDAVDYRGMFETVTIAQGSASLVLQIPIIYDDAPEGDEVFGILIYNADGVELEGEPNRNQLLSLTVTIIGDD